MKKIINILVCISMLQFALAQEFEARLSPASTSGLYKIRLSPEVISLSGNDISHIRIYDSHNNEIPFVFYPEKELASRLIKFPFISRDIIPNVSTSIIVSNSEGMNIDGLNLRVANTQVSKKYNIYGSNDNKEWFGLVNNQKVSDLSSQNETSVLHKFNFPKNDYKYLKFEFIDKNSLPINVLEASLTMGEKSNNQSIQLKNFKQEITTNKKLKQTHVSISFDKPQVVNQIKFNVVAPNYYLRQAEILVEKIKIIKKRENHYQDVFTRFVLNSKQSNQFEIGTLFEKQFTIVIDNDDNPELEFQSIDFYQKESFIVTDLKATENYSVVINSEFTNPSYDLGQSGINFADDYEVLSILDLSENKHSEKSDLTKSFWQTPLFMWICIVIAVLILAFFSFSMIKDMGKEE